MEYKPILIKNDTIIAYLGDCPLYNDAVLVPYIENGMISTIPIEWRRCKSLKDPYVAEEAKKRLVRKLEEGRREEEEIRNQIAEIQASLTFMKKEFKERGKLPQELVFQNDFIGYQMGKTLVRTLPNRYSILLEKRSKGRKMDKEKSYVSIFTKKKAKEIESELTTFIQALKEQLKKLVYDIPLWQENLKTINSESYSLPWFIKDTAKPHNGDNIQE